MKLSVIVHLSTEHSLQSGDISCYFLFMEVLYFSPSPNSLPK